MQEIQYIGEHLLPGQVGHFAVLTAFVSALLSALSFFKSARHPDDFAWRRLSRISWWIHSAAILATIGMLFYIMLSQMYEYRYAWDHVSDDLPMRYIFSAFWEGQEGSFLLWMFWHVVLGGVILFTAKRWESGVMIWLSLVQVVLVTMIAGIYFTDDIKIGSSPFVLLRGTLEAPIFSNPNYLSMIEGNGLNPLLQNYWMTIHPPTLFLGFASVTIPFCFAMAGLQQKDHLAWMKPAMPWTLFSAGILGLGILMGGAWAYEALSFGGYWAWDPVENMSLVPWLILLAALHGNFIARHTSHSIKATYWFYFAAFILVLYSTFLTRSGILGEESVHSFTEMGLEWQLVGFIGLFAFSSIYLMVAHNKSIPVIKNDEKMESREFWMFVGALVLVFSSILITFTTSIPVWNKLLDVYGSITGKGDMTQYHRAMPLDVIGHHNRFQLWIGVLLAIISVVGQALRFKAMGWEVHRMRFRNHMIVSILVSAVLSFLLSLWIQLPSWQYIVLLVAASFGVVANVEYILRFVKGKWTSMASAIAHGGFALMIIGIMASGLNKRTISENRFAQEGIASDFDAGKNAFLIEDLPMYMNGYWVTYKSDTLTDLTRYYEVEFIRVNEQGDTVEQFTTNPNVLYERKMTKVASANPNTKRYLDRDVFTWIAGLPPEQQDVSNVKKLDSMLTYTPLTLIPGRQIGHGPFLITLDSIVLGTHHEGYVPEEDDLVISGAVTVQVHPDSTHVRPFMRTDSAGNPVTVKQYTAYPTLIVRKGLLYTLSHQINDYNIKLRLPADVVDSLLPVDESLKYDMVSMTRGKSITWRGKTITMSGVDKNVSHPGYHAEEGDIAIQGIFDIVDNQTNRRHTIRPLFFIRDGRALNLKAYSPEDALHIRLERIDPEKEEFHLMLAQSMEQPALQVEIARDVPRNDYIVLEAIVFPGINLFWAGSCLMLIGMFLGMYKRLKKK